MNITWVFERQQMRFEWGASYNIIFFFIFVLIFVFVILSIYFFLGKLYMTNFNMDKISTYECGFIPFEDARIRFEVNFYVISILFLLFDLEVIFIIPWAISFSICGGLLEFFGIILFLGILGFGFVFEVCFGLLEL